MFTHVNVLTGEIIGAAIEVHRHLGPGLLESAYLQCLTRELVLKEIPFKREWPLPLEYKGIRWVAVIVWTCSSVTLWLLK